MPKIFPEEKFPANELPVIEEVDHYTQWADACRGVGETTSHFDYAGPLTETVLFGTIGIRFPQGRLGRPCAQDHEPRPGLKPGSPSPTERVGNQPGFRSDPKAYQADADQLFGPLTWLYLTPEICSPTTTDLFHRGSSGTRSGQADAMTDDGVKQYCSSFLSAHRFCATRSST